MTHDPSNRPNLLPDRAVEIAREHFSLQAARAEPLPSDRDQNFLLIDERSERRYVLKLAHSGEDRTVLDFQNRILEHLARAGFGLSEILLANDGREIVEVPGPEDQVYFTRLLTWLPGEPLYRANPHTGPLLEGMGAFLGGMDLALGDFAHPAQDRVLEWNLTTAGETISAHLEDVADPVRRGLLEDLQGKFLERLEPLTPDLRTSVIHGDANDHNVLVSLLEPGAGPEARRIVGVLDFGDAVKSYTVGDAAIAAAYAMLGKSDPLSAAAWVVAGYHRTFPVSEREMAALFPLMGLRLCISVAMSAFQRRREPDNEYLSVSEDAAWDLLARLTGESLDLPHYLFRERCGLDPVPGARATVAWLQAHGNEAAPVVGRFAGARPGLEADQGPRAATAIAVPDARRPVDLRTARVHVFDLSVDSLEFGLTPEAEDVEGWTELLFRKLRSVGADVGVGRYDEVRQLYTSDIFRAQGEGAPEWRTVHIAVDLFLDAGSQVFTPFDAVVHSVADNAGALDYGPTVILEHRTEGESPGTASLSRPLRFWTLYGHLDPGVLSLLSSGMRLARGEPFARIGAFPRNGGWPPHLHFQVITDILGRTGDFPGVAPPSQRKLWRALSPDPNLILAIPRATKLQSDQSLRQSVIPGPASPGQPSGAPLTATTGRSRGEILEGRRRHLGPTLSVAYQRPLKIVRGQRQFLVDEEGQSYLDCVNNVPHVGHSHPRVVEAACCQMALLNTNTRYLHDLLVEYAERLVATLPQPLSVVYFVCSGSEANELALRMARTHTGRRNVLVVEGAYHGNTSSMVELSPYKFAGPGGEGPPDWVRTTLMPDPYRGLYRAGPTPETQGHSTGMTRSRRDTRDHGSRERGATPRGEPEYLPRDLLGERYAGDVSRLVSGMEADGVPVAAFFCEPLLGCGGQIVPPKGYLPAAFEHVRRAGGLCVADEVQVGFGRVGSHFWAFEAQGAVPDIVTLGKPMGNGHPIGAVVTTPEIAASFDTGMEYFNTFGGNPVSCAVGLAVLDVLAEEGLQENARIVGQHLLQGLRSLQAEHSLIGDVRGMGLYVGVELVSDPGTREPATLEASRVKERLRDRRILLSTDGPDDNVLKIKPPLVFTVTDADRLIGALDEVLEEDGLRR